MRHYTLDLPYHKQGDDLAGCMENARYDAVAFLRHARMLESTAVTLRKVAALAKKGLLKINDAGTHHIGVICEETIGAKLVQKNILSRCEAEEDADDYDDAIADEAERDAEEEPE